MIGNATNLSKEDINNIKELCETKTTEEIMHIYKCTRNQIARYVKNTQANKNRSWTKKDDDLITELSKTKTPVEIATIINKSAASVEDRLKVLKVIKAKKIYWSPEAVNKLKDLWGNHPIEEISKQLNIDVSSIVFKARILSLPSYYDSLDGMTIKEVAALLGITSDKISTTWFNLGLNIRTKVISRKSRKQK